MLSVAKWMLNVINLFTVKLYKYWFRMNDTVITRNVYAIHTIYLQFANTQMHKYNSHKEYKFSHAIQKGTLEVIECFNNRIKDWNVIVVLKQWYINTGFRLGNTRKEYYFEIWVQWNESI